MLRAWPHGSKSEAARNGRRYFGRTLQRAAATSATVSLEDLNDLKVLGEDGQGRVVFHNPKTRTVRQFEISRFRYEDLLQLAGERALQMVAPLKCRPKKVAVNGMILTQIGFLNLRNSIAICAGKTKLGRYEEIGNGVWTMGDEFLIVGDRTIQIAKDGSVKTVQSPLCGKFLIREVPNLELLPVEMIQKRLEMTPEIQIRGELWKVWRLLAQWNWKHRSDALLALGLALATVLQSVWIWRPQIYLTGPSKAGKSLLLRFLARLLGPAARLSEGTTSEAGIRQELGVASVAPFLDEFDELPAYHRQRILGLFRSAGPKGKISKGTPGHHAVIFRVVFMGWVASIEVPLERAADANRFIILELGKAPPDMEAPRTPDVENLGLDLIAAAIRAAPRARELEAILGGTSIVGVDSRMARNLAVPVSMLCALVGATDKRAIRLLRYYARQHQSREIVAQVSDEEDLLAALLAAEVPDDDRKPSTVEHEIRGGRLSNQLTAYGLRKAPKNRGLFIAPNVVRNKLLRETRWANVSIRSILLRVPGAKPERQRMGFANLYGVIIPWEAIGLANASGPT